jgi:hypothetical protein
MREKAHKQDERRAIGHRCLALIRPSMAEFIGKSATI